MLYPELATIIVNTMSLTGTIYSKGISMTVEDFVLNILIDNLPAKWDNDTMFRLKRKYLPFTIGMHTPLNSLLEQLTDYKTCSKCKKLKPRTSYYFSNDSTDRIQSRCIECDSEKGKLYRTNSIHYKVYIKRYYVENNYKCKARVARRRAELKKAHS